MNDPQLMVAVTGGDTAAFAEVYSRHAGRVREVAGRVCADADDVVQDVFTSLWRQPERFDAGRGSLRTFLLSLAHNRGVDIRRAADRRRAREVGDARRHVSVETRTESHALARVEAAAIHAFLYRLPQTEREAIALAFLCDYTYRQVAALLQQPEGTVKTRVRTGLARLAKLIAEQPGYAPRATVAVSA